MALTERLGAQYTGLLSERPLTALLGDTFFATDTLTAYVWSDNTWAVLGGGSGGGAPLGASYVVISPNAILTDERQLAVVAPITLADNGAGETVEIGLNISGIDHGGLAGLGDDDHTQYLRLAGRAGGQTAYGGTGAAETLTLVSTAHATKGNIILGAAGLFDLTPAGQLQLPVQGSAGGLLIGTDVNLYRSAANVLKTNDSFLALGHIGVGSGSIIAARTILSADEEITLTTGQTATGIGGMVTARAANTVSGAKLYGLYYMAQSAGSAGTWGNFADVASIYGITTLSKNTHDVARSLKLELGSAVAEPPTITLFEGIGFVNTLEEGAFTTFKGINIPDMCAGAGSVGTFYGLDIAAQTVVTASIGIRLGAFATSALWLNTNTPASGVIHWGTAKDTNLYRSAANVLKTDDAFHAGGGLAADTVVEITGAAGVTVDGCLIKDGRAALALGLRETSGPTDLVVGAVADGEYLKRVGATIVSGVPAGGGAMATDPLWDAAGDLAVGTGADTGARLAKGNDDEVLTMVAGAVAWAAAPAGGGGGAGLAITFALVLGGD